ncbi:early nodulin-55-2-like [Pistacia vera]|uniref:early nodulin-55-2-like n=1 Tax=Pistacia vera TaxID=55513 RepID=UPI001262D7D9|nr:early nodulin-55-2-like [Pistacia vera]
MFNSLSCKELMGKIFALLVFILSLSCAVALAEMDIYVGGSKGWSPESDVSAWAKSVKPRVGDTLVFRYTTEYDVQEASQLLYRTCNTNLKPNQVYNDGYTVIELTQPGDLYYISGNHCKDLRLYIQVDP